MLFLNELKNFTAPGRHCICSMATTMPLKHIFCQKSAISLSEAWNKQLLYGNMPHKTQEVGQGTAKQMTWRWGPRAAQWPCLSWLIVFFKNKKSNFFWMPHSTLDLIYSLRIGLQMPSPPINDATQKRCEGRWGAVQHFMLLI